MSSLLWHEGYQEKIKYLFKDGGPLCALRACLCAPAEIETVQTARGRKIVSWVEDVSVYTLIFNLVWPTKLYNFWDIVENVAGQAIVLADQVRFCAAGLVGLMRLRG